MSIEEIPRCWCRRPISLSCIRAEHLIPCNTCGGSMAIGEKSAPLAPGDQIRCKSCHAGQTIFHWDHNSAMTWLDANKYHLRQTNSGKARGCGNDSPRGNENLNSNEARNLLEMSEKGMSPERLRAKATDVLEGMKPMHAELFQALRCIQFPSKIPEPNQQACDPMRFPRILEAVLLLHGDVPEGEGEIDKAFETVLEALVSQNPLASAVSALSRLKRQCDKVRNDRKEPQPQGCSESPCTIDQASAADGINVS